MSALHIVKIGGSLARDEARLRALLAGIADGREGPCVVVPGGGPFADAVRDVQLRLRFPDALAHRLAAARRTERGQRAVIGVNIGKNKVTPPERAVDDYAEGQRTAAALEAALSRISMQQGYEFDPEVVAAARHVVTRLRSD